MHFCFVSRMVTPGRPAVCVCVCVCVCACVRACVRQFDLSQVRLAGFARDARRLLETGRPDVNYIPRPDNGRHTLLHEVRLRRARS